MGSIVVSNLGKAYKQYPSRWARLAEWFIPGCKQKHQLKWILQDINFSVSSGEAIGILGVNGAGKSTLLKMITGTTQPTTGSVCLTGRVAALLELGMGFHPDFTGRQNAFMAGQLLGLSVDDIARLMPEIESFSEIGDYIDQPIRIYSSGMQVRLAFSVATAIRPDILIVDEALAVGDIQFQQKCYQRINSFKSAGTTILFVTHDLGTIYNLCDRAIYLHDSRLKAVGDVKYVATEYEMDLKGISIQRPASAVMVSESESNYTIVAKLKDAINQNEAAIFSEESNINIEIDCLVKSGVDLSDPHLGFQIRDVKNNIIYETNTACIGKKPVVSSGKISTLFELDNNLCKGEYTICFGLANQSLGNGLFAEIIFDQISPVTFSIYRDAGPIWAGFSNMRAK